MTSTGNTTTTTTTTFTSTKRGLSSIEMVTENENDVAMSSSSLQKQEKDEQDTAAAAGGGDGNTPRTTRNDDDDVVLVDHKNNNDCNKNDGDDDVVMTTMNLDDDDNDDHGREKNNNHNNVGDQGDDHHHPNRGSSASGSSTTDHPNKKRRSSIDTEVLNQFKGLSASSFVLSTNTTTSTTSSTNQIATTRDDGFGTLKMYYDTTTTNIGSIADFNYMTEHTMTSRKPRTYISRLVTKFKSSLIALNARNISDWKLERMSILIHECMSNISRNYHSVEHVFDICEELDKEEREEVKTSTTKNAKNEAIGILSALFHDCIYTNVDGGLTQNQIDVLGK